MELTVGDTVIVDGVDATIEIRNPEVTRAVSTVAANPAVRAEMVLRQREWAAAHGGGVVEGRDIGTVVFPDAAVKVYLTADDRERASRRSKEMLDLHYDEVAADIARRDHIDSTRPASPLSVAADAVRIDTTGRDVDAIVDEVLALVAAEQLPVLSGASSRLEAQPGLVCRGSGCGRRRLPLLLAGRDPRPRARPEVGGVRDRAGPPLQHRHPPGRLPHPATDPVHGQGQPVEATAGAVPSSARSGPFRSTGARPDREALRTCEEALREGEPVVLFPEGTRQSGPAVQPLFEGASFVAARAGVPIVPVGIGGSEWAMPKGKKRILPGQGGHGRRSRHRDARPSGRRPGVPPGGGRGFGPAAPRVAGPLRPGPGRRREVLTGRPATGRRPCGTGPGLHPDRHRSWPSPRLCAELRHIDGSSAHYRPAERLDPEVGGPSVGSRPVGGPGEGPGTAIRTAPAHRRRRGEGPPLLSGSGRPAPLTR